MSWADPGFLEEVHIYKSVGVRFADFISFFLKYPMKIKLVRLGETKLFQFNRILKNVGRGVEFERTPLDPPLNV